MKTGNFWWLSNNLIADSGHPRIVHIKIKYNQRTMAMIVHYFENEFTKLCSIGKMAWNHMTNKKVGVFGTQNAIGKKTMALTHLMNWVV